MTTKLRSLFTSSLLLFAGLGFCQESEDSLAYVRPFSPSIYLDYGKLLTLPANFETKYEGGIELLLWEKFPMIVEVGQSTLTPEGAYSNGTYESQGLYYRIGVGYVSQFTPKNKIGITVRYASSTFDETGRIFIESPSGVQDNFIQNINREDLSATWYEAVLYSDRKLSDLFSIGLNLRLRILGNYDEQEDIDVYAIPGYGRSFENSIPAANLFLKITL